MTYKKQMQKGAVSRRVRARSARLCSTALLHVRRRSSERVWLQRRVQLPGRRGCVLFHEHTECDLPEAALTILLRAIDPTSRSE